MLKKVKKNNQEQKSTFESQLQSNLKNKLNIDKRADVSFDEQNKQITDHSTSTQTFKQKWNNQSVDIDVVNEVKDYKKFLQIAIGASLLASNSVIYGSSTSLFACQHSSYENIINRCCGLFTPKSFLDFCWKLLWFLPFIITFALVCAVVYAIDSALYTTGYELAIIFAFVGINIVGLFLLLLLKRRRPTALINQSKFADNPSKIKHLLIALMTAIILFSLAFVIRFAWNQGYPTGKINYDQYVSIVGQVGQNGSNLLDNIGPNASIETSYTLQILAGGFLCGLVMFLPGFSGSILLSTVGANSYLNTATRYAFANYTPDPSIVIGTNWAWTTIVIAFIGLICGFVSSCFIARYLLQKQNDIFNTLAIGAAGILFIVTLISLSSFDYQVLGKEPVLLGISLALMFILIIGGCGASWFYGYKKSLSISWMWNN